MAFATLPDLKAHLNLPSAVVADDDELELMLDAAEEMVANLVAPFDGGTVTERVIPQNGLVILRNRPVSAVAVDGVEVSGYDLDASAGVLTGVSGRAPVTVTYTVGDGTVPAAVTLATVIIAAHLFETQRVPMQGSAVAPPGFSGGIDAQMPTARGFALPNRALELLRPYARQVSIA